MLNEKKQSELLQFAKDTIESRLNKNTLPVFLEKTQSLMEIRGVFVTLKKHGQLRGCIGNIVGVYPLIEGISKMAQAAAFEDPRFPPLEKEEFPNIKVEISVLTVPKKINSIDEIVVGKHGLIIKKGFYQGVLLPQVPIEQGWDRDAYLVGISRKAGLPPDGWKDADLSTFEAQVFGD